MIRFVVRGWSYLALMEDSAETVEEVERANDMALD
jgi:hypothetical protein